MKRLRKTAKFILWDGRIESLLENDNEIRVFKSEPKLRDWYEAYLNDNGEVHVGLKPGDTIDVGIQQNNELYPGQLSILPKEKKIEVFVPRGAYALWLQEHSDFLKAFTEELDTAPEVLQKVRGVEELYAKDIEYLRQKFPGWTITR